VSLIDFKELKFTKKKKNEQSINVEILLVAIKAVSPLQFS
jgi:hypothetical protein